MSLESLSEKQVQKEIALLEKKMKAVHAEFESLNKRRTACYILLGEDPAPAFVAAEPVAAPEANAAAKKNVPPKRVVNYQSDVAEVLRSESVALDVNEIIERLRNKGGLELKRNTLEATLKKHPELFSEAEEGKWIAVQPVEEMETSTMVEESSTSH